MIGGVAFVRLVIMLCLFDWMWYLLCHFDEFLWHSSQQVLVRSNERMTPTKIIHILKKNISIYLTNSKSQFFNR